MTLGLWRWCGPRGVFLIFPVWAVFEFFYRARARQSIICRNCGFDPYLYKFDVQLARQRVEIFWAEKSRKKQESGITPSQSTIKPDEPAASKSN